MYFNVPAGYALLLRTWNPTESSPRRSSPAGAVSVAPQTWSSWPAPRTRPRPSRCRPTPVGQRGGEEHERHAATSAYYPSGRSDCIRVPLPGVSIKLAPVGPKLEIRVKGPSVTPGYFENPSKTREAFDDDGYYCTGDAVRLVDEDDAGKGLVFDGQINEDFKLSSGIWVSLGAIRPGMQRNSSPTPSSPDKTGTASALSSGSTRPTPKPSPTAGRWPMPRRSATRSATPSGA